MNLWVVPKVMMMWQGIFQFLFIQPVTLFANWTGWIRPPGRSKSGRFCGMPDQNQPQKGAFRTKTGLPAGSPDQNQPVYVGLDQMVNAARAWTKSHAPPRTGRCLDISTYNLGRAALCLDQAEGPWTDVEPGLNSQPLPRLVPVSLELGWAPQGQEPALGRPGKFLGS